MTCDQCWKHINADACPSCGRVYVPRDFAAFVDGYIEAALWAGMDDEQIDQYEGTSDAFEESAREHCAAFIKSAGVDYKRALALRPANYLGHDFFLTRCGHGTGFWDRDELPETLQKRLTELSKQAGEVWVTVGDDGLAYID